MPLDQDQINQKLAQLEEYLKQLGELKDKPRGDFTEKSMIEAAAEREVYKVCQQVIDIAQTINADLGFGPPRFYRDLFTRLGDKKIISKGLQVKLEKMAGLRNKLAHEYAKVNPEEIYRVVTRDYQDLIEFSEAVAKYIKKSP
ncbi:hypothetical protein A3I57_03300 [Candidatus Beckwithbacteria bacterium RIFCSPLOWO2_02_FULL_47_23]|uniref:DUF86 domain-containing protein n=2 Tax=Candidatus Beckwithiibacteriota TaxID=1752726 RepID=A0A1F5DWP7_9BACT|nr:MAG: hypothetical protein A3E73_00775 [Candidatus Beckwithbacteria bacterium RIFCSPHIGHO2_12_FULL_47_17]OGD59446.1 MAG: hypothetical protein A3I57_03300 [Candidatus Beckwithbacteria bacterium RIFCSPLOWO2_02_FULL_47_23]